MTTASAEEGLTGIKIFIALMLPFANPQPPKLNVTSLG